MLPRMPPRRRFAMIWERPTGPREGHREMEACLSATGDTSISTMSRWASEQVRVLEQRLFLCHGGWLEAATSASSLSYSVPQRRDRGASVIGWRATSVNSITWRERPGGT
jgi:hypothetical protein